MRRKGHAFKYWSDREGCLSDEPSRRYASCPCGWSWEWEGSIEHSIREAARFMYRRHLAVVALEAAAQRGEK